jgi:hypothetical protein
VFNRDSAGFVHDFDSVLSMTDFHSGTQIRAAIDTVMRFVSGVLLATFGTNH